MKKRKYANMQKLRLKVNDVDLKGKDEKYSKYSNNKYAKPLTKSG